VLHRNLPIIGWNEYVDIPDWGISALRAKVDTGARSSALHVEKIRELPRGRVYFEVVLHRHERDRRVRVVTRIQRRGRVRSSTGHQSQRIFVRTRVRLGEQEHEIELSLVDRERMIHRMLLGRSAIESRYLVDVAHRTVLGRRRRKRAKHRRPHAASE
jgi:hypothetical protein